MLLTLLWHGSDNGVCDFPSDFRPLWRHGRPKTFMLHKKTMIFVSIFRHSWKWEIVHCESMSIVSVDGCQGSLVVGSLPTFVTQVTFSSRCIRAVGRRVSLSFRFRSGVIFGDYTLLINSSATAVFVTSAGKKTLRSRLPKWFNCSF